MKEKENIGQSYLIKYFKLKVHHISELLQSDLVVRITIQVREHFLEYAIRFWIGENVVELTAFTLMI